MNKLLIGILIAAALLRFVGTNPGPNKYHPDEPIIYGSAIAMVKENTLDPQRLDYGGAAIYINYLLDRFIFIPIGWLLYYLEHSYQISIGTIHLPISPLEAERILQVYILGNREVNAIFWGRYVTAFFGLGTVFLTYLLGKKLFGVKAGLIAALLLAFNFRHVVNSHLDLPDIYNSFFLVFSVLASTALFKNPGRKNYVLAGVLAGISLSVKYQFFALIPLALAHFWSSKKLMNKEIILSLFLSGLTFLIINPYFLIHIEEVLYWQQAISQKYAVGMNRFNLYPFSYLFHIDYGPLEFTLVIIGMVAALIKDFKKSALLLSIIIPFFSVLVYFSNGGFYVRNFISTTPLLLIFAAFAISVIFEFLKPKVGQLMGVVILCGLLVAALWVPSRNSIINSYYYSQPWNYDLTIKWMKENMTPETVVAASAFDPPGGPEVKKTEFKLDGAFSLAEHKENKAEYALINLDWASNAFYFWTNYGFNEARLFWNKPVEIMRNTFYGLASEELFRYQIFSATKPWQAPDADLVFAKIPQWPDVKMKEIKTFSFAGNSEDWGIQGNYDGIEVAPFFDPKSGKADRGTLKLSQSGNRFGTIRLSSPAIPVSGGHLYRVSGFIKTGQALAPGKRDGFLRLDFYVTEDNFGARGNVSSLSSRVYGTDNWMKKEITERAPDNARFLVISFQSGDNNPYWLDDVVVNESVNSVSDITLYPPYIKKEVDLDTLYPNSHGNL